MEIAGESLSIESTSGFSIICRTDARMRKAPACSADLPRDRRTRARLPGARGPSRRRAFRDADGDVLQVVLGARGRRALRPGSWRVAVPRRTTFDSGSGCRRPRPPAFRRRWGMADAGLFIGWGGGSRPRGRGGRDLQLDHGVFRPVGRRHESIEPVLLSRAGRSPGLFFLRGGRRSSRPYARTTSFRRRSGASPIVDNVGVVGASMGARLERLMGSYTDQIAQFA